MREITPEELRNLMEGGNVTVVDVREPWEAEICTIGGILIPLRSLAARLGEIPPGRPVVAYCHHGMRSLTAARLLSEAGYDALSLAGGIAAWASAVEPAMPRY